MRISWAVILLIMVFSCKEDQSQNKIVFDTSDLNQLNKKLLEVVMEDAFTPPVASRVYVYPHIAQYITLLQFYPDSLVDLSSKLNGLAYKPIQKNGYENAELASLLSFCKVAKKVIFSEHYMDSEMEKLKSQAKERSLSSKNISASEIFADSMAAQIIRWLNKDKYVESRTFDRFTSSANPGNWRETPPDYMSGLEPHWSKIRPLIIDSASIYKAKLPPAYNFAKGSDFYKMVDSVYQQSKHLDSTLVSIAWFWDDNPNLSDHSGHAMSIIHKYAPPGHWLNIVHQINERQDASIFKASKAFTFTAISMFDGLISCWYEKYKTNLVRPITYIQEYIDPNWKTILQTPPFPEYTSGHSVVSACAASMMTEVYGENFAFTDSTQILFDLPVRSFKSFHDAAWEVSLSRFYGGIHYMQGIREGNNQGKYLASYILEKVKK